MCERLVAVETPPDQALLYDPVLRDQIESELRNIYDRVIDTLRRERIALDRVTEALLDQRVFDRRSLPRTRRSGTLDAPVTAKARPRVRRK